MQRSKKSTKLPTKRSRFKYPALEKSANLHSRQDEISDVKSYFDKLPEGMQKVTLSDGTEKVMNVKEWMNNFVEEEVNADFRHPGQKINKTKKDKKRIYNKNNARNRCTYTKAKMTNKLDEKSDLLEFEDILQQNVDSEDDDVFYEPKMKL